MKKLYEKDQVLFAIVWIIIYCAVIGTIRSNSGDDSLVTAGALIILAVVITVFLKREHLEELYGLRSWPKGTKGNLYFIPLWILASGNLWCGVHSAGFVSVFSMILVGYLEEIIFRGFLFRGMLSQNSFKTACILSSVSFGIGHIINLFTGQATIATVFQIIFAIALGFLFTMVYYISGSLWPGIVLHSLIDVFSVIGHLSDRMEIIYIAVTVIVSVWYCQFLQRCHDD